MKRFLRKLRMQLRRARGSALGRAIGTVCKAGDRIAPWATIIAAVVAVVSFYYGYRQFRETQEATRQTLNLQRINLNMQRESLDLERDDKAVDLLVKYNDLMREAYSDRSSTKAAGAFWRDNGAIVIAESIFQLKAEDNGWRETVRWILENHSDFLKGGLDCPTYDGKFVQFVSQVVHCDDICSTPVRCAP